MGYQRHRNSVNGNRYDFVVIQEQSLNPVKNERDFINGVKGVMALINANKFILYATWGRNDESPDLATLGLTREEMTERLSIAYNNAGKECGATVAEVGKAFLEYSKNNDRNSLYNPDNTHPSAIGSELAAKIIFNKMINQ